MEDLKARLLNDVAEEFNRDITNVKEVIHLSNDIKVSLRDNIILRAAIKDCDERNDELSRMYLEKARLLVHAERALEELITNSKISQIVRKKNKNVLSDIGISHHFIDGFKYPKD
jgi:hypothetical protein